MMRVIAAAGVLALAVGWPAAAGAQTPGEGRMSGSEMDARYMAYVIENVSELLADWRTALEARDVERLGELYTEGAVLTLPGRSTVRGRDGIEAALDVALAEIGPFQVTMADLDASGAIAFVTGMYSYQRQRGTLSERVGGEHITIIMREGRTWRIRLQRFIPAE